MKEYAIYKGEEFLFMGTSKECASYLGVKRKSIYWYCSPTNKKRDKGNRIIIEKMEDDE